MGSLMTMRLLGIWSGSDGPDALRIGRRTLSDHSRPVDLPLVWLPSRYVTSQYPWSAADAEDLGYAESSSDPNCLRRQGKTTKRQSSSDGSVIEPGA